MQRIFSSSKETKTHFLCTHSTCVRDCIPNMNKIESIKRFYFPYPSSKLFSIAGAMQKNFSSSKKTKIHFLASNFIHVRDRTACLNSFWFVAYMQTKRVSSDSPTPKVKSTYPDRVRAFCFWGNAQILYLNFFNNGCISLSYADT